MDSNEAGSISWLHKQNEERDDRWPPSVQASLKPATNFDEFEKAGD